MSGCHFDKHCTPRDEHHEITETTWKWATFKEGDMLVFEDPKGLRDTCFYGPWIINGYYKDCTTEGKDCCIRNYEKSLTNTFSETRNKYFKRLIIEINPANNTEDLVINSTGILSYLNSNQDSICPFFSGKDCIIFYSLIYSKSKGIIQFADYDNNKNVVLWKRVY